LADSLPLRRENPSNRRQPDDDNVVLLGPNAIMTLVVLPADYLGITNTLVLAFSRLTTLFTGAWPAIGFVLGEMWTLAGF
jgi:hypothetical protein